MRHEGGWRIPPPTGERYDKRYRSTANESRAVDGVRPLGEQIGDHCHLIFCEGRPTVMREAANTTETGKRNVRLRNSSWHFGRRRPISVVNGGGRLGGSRCCDAQCSANTHARRRTGRAGGCAVAGDSDSSRLFRAAGRQSEANSRRRAHADAAIILAELSVEAEAPMSCCCAERARGHLNSPTGVCRGRMSSGREGPNGPREQRTAALGSEPLGNQQVRNCLGES